MTQLVTVRASSWGRLFDCAYAWEGEHVLGLRRPSCLRSTLGTAIHAGTAAFDQARLDRRPISADDASGVFVQALHHPEDEVDYRGDNITLTDAEVIGLTLTAKYCVDISPHFQFKSVEAKLAPLDIECDNGVKIRMTGTMDRARTAHVEPIQLPDGNELLLSPGGVIIPDIKSGARIITNGVVNLKGKAAQLGAYQLMHEEGTGEHTLGGQIIGLQATAKAETAVSPIIDGKRVMLGTDTSPGLITMAATMFKTGFFPPNPQSSLCNPKFCARWDTCIYHE